MSALGESEDIDEIAVERACRGEQSVRLSRAEMAVAHRILEARNLSAAEIAERLGVTPRTVTRWRTGEHRPISRPTGWHTEAPRKHLIKSCPECGQSLSSSHMARHRRRLHPEDEEMAS